MGKATPTVDLAPYRTAAGDTAAEQAQAHEGLAIIEAMVIATSEDYTFAAEIMRELATRKKSLDDRRKSVTRPLQAVIAEINDWFHGPIQALDRGVLVLKGKVAAFLSDQRQAQARALERAPDPGALAMVPSAPVAAGISTRAQWRWEITDPAVVPRELWAPDPALVAVAVSQAIASGTEVPGVRIWQEQTVAVRSYQTK